MAAGRKIGAYILMDRIGHPNMGQVWRARHEQNPSAIFAVKCVSDHFQNKPQMLERFWRECAVQQRLRHPSIVPVKECVQEDGNLYLVMQFVPGGSLEDRLDQTKGQPLPLEDTLRISRQILDALNYAHQQGVIHRDVKPSNILLDGGRAYLTDFGIALLMARSNKGANDSGGTCSYMSPEQILPNQVVDQRSDVYGFGCVMYEMLTGRPPFPAMPSGQFTDDQIKFMHLNTPATPPRSVNPAVPERLDRVVMTSLAKKPDDRFPGCGSLLRAVEGPAQQQFKLAPKAVAAPVSLAKNLAAIVLNGAVMSFFLSVWVDVYPNEPKEIVPLALLGTVLIAGVLQLRLLHKAWSAIQDAQTSMTAGKAVGFLFVPFVNLYWMARSYLGFSREYNRFVERRGLKAPRQHPWIYLLFCLSVWAMILVSNHNVLDPVAVVFSIQQFVCVPLLVWSLVRAINGVAGGAR